MFCFFAQAKVVGLTHEQITEVVNQNMSSISKCYTDQLLSSPGLEGSMVTDIEIDSQGRVIKALVDSSDLGSKKLEKCVTDAILRIRFAKPDDKVSVRVRYPFHFKQSAKK
jgi:TonB family protein